jgi:3',5'-cyclic-AMP phosphodiesterase
MLIAQISDLHIKEAGRPAYGIVDTTSMLRTCVAHLQQLATPPDALLITGDLVDYGNDAEYTVLKSLLAPLSLPIYLSPGNHDERSALRKAFNTPAFNYLHQSVPFVPDSFAPSSFIQYAVNVGELRLIALDTVVPFEGHGALCNTRLQWLDERLREDDSPTIITMHHPPFLTGIAHMDAIGLLEGATQLEAIVSQYQHIERILCGHLHRSIQCKFGNTIASTCPSPAHQVVLDLQADAADCFAMEPPGYQLHVWRGRRLVTHHVVIGDYPGPYRFREGGVLID